MARPQAPAAALAQAVPGKKSNFALGLAGALAGSVIGSLIYFAIFKSVGVHLKFYLIGGFSGIGLILKFTAIGVGFLAGLGADLLGRKEGSKELGVIAAVFTLVGVVGAQYLVAHSWWHDTLHEFSTAAKSAYEEQVAQAKKLVAAIPTGSDSEIRSYMAKQEAADSGDKIDPKSFTADEVKVFKENDLSEAQKLASGQITKQNYEKENEIDANQAKKELDAEEGTFKAVFLLLLLNRLNLFSLCAAAALAFKVSANA